MKMSFDGIRKTLAREFNDLVETDLSYEQRIIMCNLRQTIGGLLCAYDSRDQPDDCNMLADEVELLPIPGDEEGEITARATWLRHNAGALAL